MIEGAELNEREQKDRKRASIISLFIGLALMLVKFWAHNMTNSQAILSDAMESIVNVVAAGLALFVVHYASKPLDKDHPYGHGKVEYFSSAFEGGLITFAAVLIILEAIKKYFSGAVLTELSTGLLLVTAAGVVNLLLGLYLLRSGQKSGSVALRASGKHVITDFWSSVIIIGGLILVLFTGWFWLDAVLAFGVGCFLAYEGVKLVRESISGLMDEEDVALLQDLAKIFEKMDFRGIIQIHHVRVIRSGWYHHIDAHVVLPEFWDVNTVHSVMNKFENGVIKNYKYGGEMNFHVDPCRRVYCQSCDLVNCPIREDRFVQKIPVTVEHLRSQHEPLE
ncbi:MAG: cation transporter [Bdellovibrionales bacterium]|nr:cation transporter [Bdellovibrionales bacterium]